MKGNHRLSPLSLLGFAALVLFALAVLLPSYAKAAVGSDNTQLIELKDAQALKDVAVTTAPAPHTWLPFSHLCLLGDQESLRSTDEYRDNGTMAMEHRTSRYSPDCYGTGLFEAETDTRSEITAGSYPRITCRREVAGLTENARSYNSAFNSAFSREVVFNE